MSNNSREGDLLEYLTAELGCVYISDLCSDKVSGKHLAQTLEQICPGAFPVSAWRDAANYLLRSPVLPETEEAARIQLREGLGKR